MTPVTVIQIPFDRLANPAVEGFIRSPAKGTLDFSGVDGIPKVMTRPVCNVDDLLTVAGRLWHQLIKNIANGLNYIDVSHLIVPPNIVGFARFSLVKYFIQGAGVVFYVKPVPNLVTFAVQGMGFPSSAFSMVSGISFSGN